MSEPWEKFMARSLAKLERVERAQAARQDRKPNSGKQNIGAAIDQSRPILENKDGTFSTEETITVGADGRYFNIPTIVDGQRVGEERAIALWRKGGNPDVGSFDALDEAENAARSRTNRIGEVRGDDRKPNGSKQNRREFPNAWFVRQPDSESPTGFSRQDLFADIPQSQTRESTVPVRVGEAILDLPTSDGTGLLGEYSSTSAPPAGFPSEQEMRDYARSLYERGVTYARGVTLAPKAEKDEERKPNGGKQNFNIDRQFPSWPGDEPNPANVIPAGMGVEPEDGYLPPEPENIRSMFQYAGDDNEDYSAGARAGREQDEEALRGGPENVRRRIGGVAPDYQSGVMTLLEGQRPAELPSLEEARANAVGERQRRLDDARFGLDPGTLGPFEPAIVAISEGIRAQRPDRLPGSNMQNVFEGLNYALLADPSTGRRDAVSRRNYDYQYGAPWDIGQMLEGNEGAADRDLRTEDQRANQRLADSMDPTFLGEDEITITAPSRPESFTEAAAGLLTQDSWETPEDRRQGLANPFLAVGDFASDLWTMPGEAQEEQAMREAGALFDYGLSGRESDLRRAQVAAAEYGVNAGTSAIELTPAGFAGDVASLGRVGARGAARETTDALPARRLGEDAPMGFEGAPRPQAEPIDAEFSPAPQRAFQAAVRDPETGRTYTGLDHMEAIDSAPDAATRARLEQIYNAPTEDPNAVGFVVNGQFMSREDGLQALRAQRRPVSVGEQVNRDGSVTERDPIDWDAPVAPERSALRDLGLGAAAGVGAGFGADALLNQEANASDGETDENGLPILPMIGGAAGAYLATRGRRLGVNDRGLSRRARAEFDPALASPPVDGGLDDLVRGDFGVRRAPDWAPDEWALARNADGELLPPANPLTGEPETLTGYDRALLRQREMQPPSINSAPRGNIPQRRLGDDYSDVTDAGARNATETGTDADLLASLPTDPEQWREVMGSHPWINSPSRAQMVIMATARNPDGSFRFSSNDILEQTGMSSDASLRVLISKARSNGIPIPTRNMGSAGATVRPNDRLARTLDVLESAPDISREDLVRRIGTTPTALANMLSRARKGFNTDGRTPIPPELVARARRLTKGRDTGTNALIPAAAIGAGAGALAFGEEAWAQVMEGLEPLPDGVNLRDEGQWLGGWSQTMLPDGSEGIARVIRGPDGTEYTVVARQSEDLSIEVLGVRPVGENPPGAPAPRLGEGTGRRLSGPGVTETNLPPPLESDGFDAELDDGARIGGTLTAGLVARLMARRAGLRGVAGEIPGAAVAFGFNRLTGGDPVEAALLSGATPFAGRLGEYGALRAGQVIDDTFYVPGQVARDNERLMSDRQFLTRRNEFAQTLPSAAPRARRLGVERDPLDGYASGRDPNGRVADATEVITQGYYRDAAPQAMSPRVEFDSLPPAEQLAWMDRVGFDAPRAPAVPDRGNMGYVDGSTDRPPPRPPTNPFTDPNSGSSVFGEPRKPRAPRQPPPPLAERAAQRGAQGAMQPVKVATMRAIADDLGIPAQGVKATDLRRTLVRELGRQFDSTQEMVAFLRRYGVTAAALGIGLGGAQMVTEPEVRM